MLPILNKLQTNYNWQGGIPEENLSIAIGRNVRKPKMKL